MPPNPQRLADLGDIPRRYRETLLGETFLLYDNGPANEDSDVESAEEEEDSGRVLVFSIRWNIVEVLCNSSIWFLDGIFKTAPRIFAQLFTILEIRRKNIDGGEGKWSPSTRISATVTENNRAV